jgi:hypothetical protein
MLECCVSSLPACLQVMCSRSIHRGKAAQSRLKAEGLCAELVQVDVSDPLRCVLCSAFDSLSDIVLIRDVQRS